MKYELYKQNQQKKLGLVWDNRTKFATVDDRIILYRHLGHISVISKLKEDIFGKSTQVVGFEINGNIPVL